jgi:transaldolase/glucose-6-phosphate isomerase
VDSLVGPETVNTLPPQTLEAVRDHGKTEVTITRDLDQAQETIQQLDAINVSMDAVTQELEEEGVKAFEQAFKELIATIDERRKAAVSSLGPLAGSVSKRIEQLEKDLVPARLWQHDPTLWTGDPAGQAEVAIRLGWLDSVQDARTRLQGYESFAKEVHKEGIDRVLVLGMGGSSLTAEVFSSLLAGANVDAKLSLAILDSTDPHQVLQAARFHPPEKTLYIVASKSGGTAEVTAAFDYFWELSKGNGSRFIAITDPGTTLEALAKDRGFRRIFSSDPNVGGRFAALTDFGLVPAALLGMDVDRLLTMAAWMKRQSTELVPPARNPGMTLGAVLAEAALAGRGVLTVLADTPVFSLANWIEQVIAESSGKEGKGILPVALEPLDSPEVYGQDRLFIYLRQNGELDNGVAALKHAGFPVIEFPISGPYDAGAEFFRWEVAVSVACHVLGVNAFDQPDVQDSKNRTKAKIAEYQKTGQLAETDLIDLASGKDEIGKFLSLAKAGDFVAINAYLPRNKETVNSMQLLRVGIREKTKCAVPAGFGPRFQHSTGQFHKGGPNKGLFLQVVYDAKEDVDIPTEGLSFGTLLRAQALGDYEALKAAGRRVIRIRLAMMNDFRTLAQLFSIRQD